MRGKPWLQEHQDILDRWGGRKPDAEVGRMTGGHAEITIRKRREAAGLPAYLADRSPVTRRAWLLAAAAGLDFQISEVGT